MPARATVATVLIGRPLLSTANYQLLEVRSRWHGGDLLGAGYGGRESQMEGSRNCLERTS